MALKYRSVEYCLGSQEQGQKRCETPLGPGQTNEADAGPAGFNTFG